MADQAFAPYATAKAVLGIIQRLRDRGLPEPLSTSALETVGIPASMAPRTMQALRFLGLIDEGGNRTPSFEGIRRARTEEYPGQLAETIRAAYLPVFTIVNPASDSDTAIADAFRGYEPAAQREKMIALFRGLCVEANIIEAKAKQPGGAPKRPVGGASGMNRTKAPTPATKKLSPPSTEAESRHDEEEVLDIRLITAIIQQLPRDRHWTAERRERWLAAMTTAVDLLIEVRPE